VTRLVGAAAELALGAAALLGARSAIDADTALAVLNGVVGDHLAETGNPLAIEMALRHQGERLVLERGALRARFPGAPRKLLVFLHGSCRHDRPRCAPGQDGLSAIARELGFARIDLLYNTGLHVSANGRACAALLERLVAAWPVTLDELALVGHSMGGLVARSAAHAAEVEGHIWRGKLRTLVCIASPHHGAPLERAGGWVDVLLGVSRRSAPLARLGKIRSAGVTDLRFGSVLDEHRDPRGRFGTPRDVRRSLRPPPGVRCFAIAATRTVTPGGERTVCERWDRPGGERAWAPRETRADPGVRRHVDRLRHGARRGARASRDACRSPQVAFAVGGQAEPFTGSRGGAEPVALEVETRVAVHSRRKGAAEMSAAGLTSGRAAIRNERTAARFDA
jgi:pimeloyl-ACP methyl ester carboxylesterase